MSTTAVTTPAVVLAGGGSRRLGGADKTRLPLQGVALLDRVLGLLSGPVVVVGDQRSTVRPVVFTREEPPGGGPLAALAAGLSALQPVPGRVLLLAADLPFLTEEALQALVAVEGPGALAVDDDGRDQPLLSCWDTSLLRGALPARPAGGRLRVVVQALDPARVRLTGHPPPWWDCDTPEAYAQAQRWVEQSGPG